MASSLAFPQPLRSRQPVGAAARIMRGLPIAPSAALTLCDLHGWPVHDCALALDLADARVRALLHAGRERVRAALEAEVDSR